MRRAPIAAAMTCALAGCGGGHDGAPRRADDATCHARVVHGVIPPWARAGFSDPKPRMPYALGYSHEIAALLFGEPLTSPPRRNVNNKILWVARRPVPNATDLHIRARRFVGGEPTRTVVQRVVAGGPGPSIVDLPRAGCWRLQLRWAGSRDVVDLRYRTRTS